MRGTVVVTVTEVALADQAEVDAFAGVGRVEGNLTITGASGSGPVDLTPLSCLGEVTGTLKITRAAAITSLAGLERLTRVGALDVTNNAGLTTIAALANLRSVGALTIVSNPRSPDPRPGSRGSKRSPVT